jgi:hypothetical protein
MWPLSPGRRQTQSAKPPHSLSSPRREPALPSTSTANTRCRIPITGTAYSAQILTRMRILYRIQLQIHLLYPRLVFMIIRCCHQCTLSRLPYGLHKRPVSFPIYPWSHARLLMHSPNISPRMTTTPLRLILRHTRSMQLS